MQNRTLRLATFFRVSFITLLVAGVLSAVPFVKLFTIPVFVFVPGAYAFLLIKQREKSFTCGLNHFLYALGLGIFAIYMSTLGLNIFGQLVHLRHILDRGHLLAAELILSGILCLLAYKKQRGNDAEFPRFVNKPSRAAVIISAIVPLLAIFGAFRLNNGANANLSMLALMLMSLAIAAIPYKLVKHDVHGVALIIYSFSLTVLLMTSLRGWSVTGHDIQTEYYVFQLTLKHQLWNMNFYRDPYNACLSITLLPTFFASMFHIDPVLVFKTIFQSMFATLPVIIYLISLRFTKKLAAFLASILFISFPIFVNDMPFYNRQEIAFLFLGLALLALVDKTVKKVSGGLFLLLMVAMVLSHYSTTYIMCGILLVVLIIRKILARRRPILSQTKPVLSLRLVLIIFLFVFLWVAQLTGTATGPKQVIVQTFGNLNATLTDNFKSSDTSYIFGGAPTNPTELFGDYVTQQDTETPSHQAYTNANDSAYAILPKSLYNSPSTLIGRILSDVGVPASKFVAMFRSFNSKLLQLLLFVGVCVLWFKWRAKSYEHQEQYAFYLAGIVITMAVVILPFLTYEYSLLRTFQQVLIFAALPIAEGVVCISARFKKFNGFVLALIITTTFASLTGLLPQLIGGYYPQLNLSNKGTYYDLYYTHSSELQAFNWWEQQKLSGKDLVTNVYAGKKFRAQTGVNPNLSVLPDQVSQNEYVYLDYTTQKSQLNYVFYKGDWLVLKYPVNFLDANKNLVYNDGGSEYFQ